MCHFYLSKNDLVGGGWVVGVFSLPGQMPRLGISFSVFLPRIVNVNVAKIHRLSRSPVNFGIAHIIDFQNLPEF